MSYDPIDSTIDAIESLEDANKEKLVMLLNELMCELIPEVKKIRAHLEILTGEHINDEEVEYNNEEL